MDVSTPGWVRDAVFYQIFPERFATSDRFGQDGYPAKPANLQPWGADPTYHGFQGGDLLGAAEKLDYLAELGVNAIYLNPIFASASNHRYHTHDYYVVDPILGGNPAFEEFLEAAHEKQIRVVLDGVFNHASRGFFQFNHIMECGQESPYIDWFRIHGWPVNAFSEKQDPNYDAWWGLHSLPKFNTDTLAVKEFLWNVATHWLRKGIDGWRLDVPGEINDDSFWQQFRKRCKAVNPEAYIVGELWDDAQRWLQGDQFDGQMNYSFARSVLGFFAGDKIDQRDTVRCGYGYIAPRDAESFAGELDRLFNQLYHPEIVLSQLNMLGSHDTPRIANVAAFDRSSVSLIFLCQMTVPGAPNIYYGDEIGMKGRHDPYCRRAFPWNDQESWDRDLHAKVREYIRLRHEIPPLRRGDFKILYAARNLVAYQRQYAGQTAVIAFNSDTEAGEFLCPLPVPEQMSLRYGEATKTLVGGQEIRLGGRSGAVWSN